MRATYMSSKCSWLGVSDFMFGTSRIQLEGTRGVLGAPFLELLKRTQEPSWQQLHLTMKLMSLEDLIEIGGFFCILEPGYHCTNPPGMFLWEFCMSSTPSLTMNWNALGKNDLTAAAAKNMSTIVSKGLSLCCHPAHFALESRLKVRFS